MKILAAAGLTMALLAPMRLNAQAEDIPPREYALLPPYCRYVMFFRETMPGGDDPAQIKRWASMMGTEKNPVMGSMFQHMHHYCRALRYTNYATYFARNRQERLYHLSQSIAEFNYVISNARPDFPLLPEFLTKKGENLIKLGQAPAGVTELRRAIGIKPDYWPPYAALSEYYQSVGNPKIARETLEQGLAASPDEAALKRRLAELDGAKGKPKAAPKPDEKPDK